MQNFKGLVEISRTPQGLAGFQGKFSGKIPLECVRCLKEFKPAAALESHGAFLPSTKSQVSDSELIIPDDAQIDLETLIREYAPAGSTESTLSTIRIARGLCPVCGTGFERLQIAAIAPNKTISPFAALKRFVVVKYCP